MRQRYAIRPSLPGPNVDLDDGADCLRELFDRRQRGAHVHAALKARHDASGTRHPVGDILLVRCRVLFRGQFANLRTDTGTHHLSPCGRAWPGSGAIARVFDPGTGFAILPTRTPHTTGQVALARPGGLRLHCDRRRCSSGKHAGAQLPNVSARRIAPFTGHGRLFDFALLPEG
jgi:hypothetical protein